jgi:TRAP-type C4-dicarboxylate transport system permease small subunit
MYERRDDPLLPRPRFYRRLARSVSWGIGLIVGSLVIGMAGYHFLGGFDWLDSFLNASMILSGMGPIGELKTPAVKLFAGIYAIYSGVALISTTAVIFAPIIHRAIHRFHLQDEKR